MRRICAGGGGNIGMHRCVTGDLDFGFRGEGASLPSGSRLLPASLDICLDFFGYCKYKKLDNGNFIEENDQRTVLHWAISNLLISNDVKLAGLPGWYLEIFDIWYIFENFVNFNFFFWEKILFSKFWKNRNIYIKIHNWWISVQNFKYVYISKNVELIKYMFARS